MVPPRIAALPKKGLQPMDDRCASSDLSTSGWYFNANWRYAALISSLLAPGEAHQAVSYKWNIRPDICTTPFCFQASCLTTRKAFLVQYLIHCHTTSPSLEGNNMKLPGAAFRQTQHFPGISGCCETWVPRAHYAPWRVPTNGCSNRGSGELKWMLPKLQCWTKHLTV